MHIHLSKEDAEFYGNAPLSVKARCGALAVVDGIGYRCTECFAILGSVGCPCNNTAHEEEN